MKKAYLLIFLLLFSCSPLDNNEYVRTEGQNLIDGQGNEILLRSVGLGNWLLPEGYMWKFGKGGDRPRKIERLIEEMIGEKAARKFWREFRKNYITEADIARIKELGFNAVRPAMNWRLFMDEETGKFKKEGFKLIDNLVSWCKKHKVYVILDMHGAPGGQTGSNIDDSTNDFPELFTSEENQQRFIKLWVKLAKRYRDEPIILAYGLINEPLPEKFEQFNDQLEPLYKKTVAAIREVDSHHIISLEGADWSTDFSLFGPPFDDNLIYQFHKYWSTPDTKSIQSYLDFRERYNVPIYCGESGENVSSWYWAAYQLYEDHNIGWLFWPWKKMATQNTPYSIKKPEGWEKIAEFSRGGPKPDAAEAQAILNQFLENIKLENCVYFEDVVNSIFRRLPAKIEAENFTHKGNEKSFHLLQTSTMAGAYRTSEPVPVFELNGAEKTPGQSRPEYVVRLQAGEWLHYEVHSPIDQVLKTLIRLRATDPSTKVRLEIAGTSRDVHANFAKSQFVYGNTRPVTVTRGHHDLKLIVDKGSADIDWILWK